MNKVLLVVCAMVLVSGCTQSGSTKTVDPVIKGVFGVGVNEFSTFNNVLKPGESTILNFKVTNIGNSTASNVIIRLLNYGEFTLIDDESYSIDELNLLDSLEYSWTIKAPDTKGLDYYPLVKICYDYSSIGYKSVKIIDNMLYSPETVVLSSQEASTKGPISVDFEIENPIIIGEGKDVESFTVLFNNEDVGQVATLSESNTFGLVNYVNVSDIILRIPSFNGRLKLFEVEDDVFIIPSTGSNIDWVCKPVNKVGKTVVDYYECMNTEIKRLISSKTLRAIVEDLVITGSSGSSSDCYDCTSQNDDCVSSCESKSYYFSTDVSGESSGEKCYDNVYDCTGINCIDKSISFYGIDLTRFTCSMDADVLCGSNVCKRSASKNIYDKNMEGEIIGFCSSSNKLDCSYYCEKSDICPEPVDDMAFFEAEIKYQYCLTTDPLKISVR
ncbi:MAG: hypothetical protein GON13_03370 [Nanoarchaeota archaeon]|nr:hypothetical protein [Nanoarchaeota archaeon]